MANRPRLRRIFAALLVRALFAFFSHLTPLNAGEVPHEQAVSANEKAAVTITAASPKSTGNVAYAAFSA